MNEGSGGVLSCREICLLLMNGFTEMICQSEEKERENLVLLLISINFFFFL